VPARADTPTVKAATHVEIHDLESFSVA